MNHQESKELKTYLEQQFDEVRERFAKVDQRFDGIDQRFDGIDQRFDGIDQRFDGIDQRLDGIDGRLDGMDRRFDGIDLHLDRQDIDFNKTTKNLLETIDDATKESRSYAARLFGILDHPSLDAEGAPKPARHGRPKRPRVRQER